jgi:hypothetical protein
MMKLWIFAVMAFACTGCTMMSLERHTVAQTDSAIDLRYHEIMDNLAMVANDPSTLPSYASVYDGTIFVQDQQQLISTTVWQHAVGAAAQNGFASEAANPSINRQINQNWSIDPIVVPEKLEAIRAACQWALGGPDNVYKDSMSLLIRPEQAPPGPGRHFGVADRLAQLPTGWLCVGRLKDVPLCARYKAHAGDMWVWIMPEGMNGLADLTLIIQDIARVGVNSPTLFNFPPVYTPIRFETADSKVVDNRVRMTAQVTVDQSGHLVTDLPYYPTRIENLSTDPKFRSQIAAAAAIPH